MRRRRGPELTDEDLERLDRLGAGADLIAEAAGIDVAEVGRRLDGAAPGVRRRRDEQRVNSPTQPLPAVPIG